MGDEMTDDFVEQVSGVGALAEPARRALYLFVVAQPDAVSRDEAAAGTGLPRHSAKFHLDRLVDDGLLVTEFRRLSGRAGPGAGRPSKLYRRSARQIAVTLPERHYDLAGQILAAAVEDAAENRVPVQGAVQRAATDTGHRLAAQTQPQMHTNASRQDPLEAAAAALAAQGYEPRRDGDTLVLANCPFHDLARDHTDLVCGMNLALVTGLLERLGDSSLTVRLEPAPDRCCLTISG